MAIDDVTLSLLIWEGANKLNKNWLKEKHTSNQLVRDTLKYVFDHIALDRQYITEKKVRRFLREIKDGKRLKELAYPTKTPLERLFEGEKIEIGEF